MPAVAGLPCDRKRSLIDVATGASADGASLTVRTDEGLTLLRERPASVAT